MIHPTVKLIAKRRTGYRAREKPKRQPWLAWLRPKHSRTGRMIFSVGIFIATVCEGVSPLLKAGMAIMAFALAMQLLLSLLETWDD